MRTSPDYQIDKTLALIDQMSETDRKVFNFDIRTINWNNYCESFWLGVRRHILKERDEDLARARRIYKWVTFKYHILNMVWLSLLSILMYFLFYLIFDLIDFDFFLPSVSTIMNPSSGQDVIRIGIAIISFIFGYKLLGFVLL